MNKEYKFFAKYSYIAYKFDNGFRIRYYHNDSKFSFGLYKYCAREGLDFYLIAFGSKEIEVDYGPGQAFGLENLIYPNKQIIKNWEKYYFE